MGYEGGLVVGGWWLVYTVVATMAAGYKMPTYLVGPGSTRDNVASLSALCNMGAALYEPLLLEQKDAQPDGS